MIVSRPLELLVLAGGLGTRLRTVVSNVPKPMAEVAGRPFLESLLDYWFSQGIKHVVISTGYMADVIEDHFKSEYRGVQIDYVREQSPLGTGGGLYLALKNAPWQSDNILVVNGDTWCPINVAELCAAAYVHSKPITMTLLSVQSNDRYGAVEVSEDGLVRSFVPAGSTSTLINAGCYLVWRRRVEGMLSNHPLRFSLEQDVLPKLAASSLIAASIQECDFIDIGIPEDYRNAAASISKYKAI